jgi:hypothetical protein
LMANGSTNSGFCVNQTRRPLRQFPKTQRRTFGRPKAGGKAKNGFDHPGRQWFGRDRLLSAYRVVDGTKSWIITEAGRSVATVVLSEDQLAQQRPRSPRPFAGRCSTGWCGTAPRLPASMLALRRPRGRRRKSCRRKSLQFCPGEDIESRPDWCTADC